MRIGFGYDVHAFSEGRPLVLAGVSIPYEKGLLGHSDADALSHAVMDAMLGALALGTIGDFFPDTDPAYKDADSLQLLDRVVAEIHGRGWLIENVDSMLVMEAPKIAPFVAEMRENLASRLKVEVDRVSVKGTRSEKMGFIGRGEGVAAHAVVLLRHESA